jgi:hypothetical protein
VSETYFIRLCNAAIVKVDGSTAAPRRGGGVRTADFAVECKLIGNLLKEAPFVLAVHEPDSTIGMVTQVETESCQGIAPQLARSPFTLRCSLPRLRQHLPENYAGWITEDFQLLYDGTTVCAFATSPERWDELPNLINLHRYDWLFIDQVRDEFVKAITSEPPYEIVVIEPDDIDIYYQIKVDKSTTSSTPVVHVGGNHPNVDVQVTLPTSDDAETRVAEIAATLLRATSRFYRVMHLKTRRDALLDKIRFGVSDIAGLYSTLMDIPWWQFWRWSRYSILREIRRTIGAVAELNAQAADAALVLNDHIEAFGFYIRDVELLEPSAAYFRKHMNRQPVDLAPTLRMLDFYENETRAALTSESAALTTVLAAAVGAAVALALHVI